ncbi:PIG-L deacetylase family protein [Haloferax sp. DFSO52]|uniref:PIG-L deacetylase family protein n=1 Tax=Haloferax sp. DFSO52 TaxID=3388505 RepID=UPI003A86793E
MEILAIVAHPDDAEIFCGGTLAKHADRGDDITIAYMTRGEYGGFDTTEAAVAATREEEAERAADVLGAEATFLDFKDGRIEYSLENRLTLVDTIRKHDPDLIITHYRDDMHPDHRETAKLVTDAYYMTSLPLLDTDYPACDPDNIYYFGKPTSSFDPTVVVDTSGYDELVKKAIDEHESQVEWLQEHGGIDAEFDNLFDAIQSGKQALGRTVGAQSAEGFIALHEQSTEYLS